MDSESLATLLRERGHSVTVKTGQEGLTRYGLTVMFSPTNIVEMLHLMLAGFAEHVQHSPSVEVGPVEVTLAPREDGDNEVCMTVWLGMKPIAFL